MESIVEKLRKLRQPGPEGEYHAVTEAIFADEKQPSGGMSMIVGVHKTLEAAQESAATLCKNFPHDFLIFRGRPTHLFIDFYDPSASVILTENETFNKEILEMEKRRIKAEKKAREKDEALGLHNAKLQERGSDAHISQNIYLLMQHEFKIAELRQQLQQLESRNRERKQELREALLKNPKGDTTWKAYLRPVITKYDGAQAFESIESWWEANRLDFLPPPSPPEASLPVEEKTQPIASPPEMLPSPPEEKTQPIAPLPVEVSPPPEEKTQPIAPSPPEVSPPPEEKTQPISSPPEVSPPPEEKTQLVSHSLSPSVEEVLLPSVEEVLPLFCQDGVCSRPPKEEPVKPSPPPVEDPPVTSSEQQSPGDVSGANPEQVVPGKDNPVLSIPSVPPLSLPSPPQRRRLQRQRTSVPARGSPSKDAE